MCLKTENEKKNTQKYSTARNIVAFMTVHCIFIHTHLTRIPKKRLLVYCNIFYGCGSGDDGSYCFER